MYAKAFDLCREAIYDQKWNSRSKLPGNSGIELKYHTLNFMINLLDNPGTADDFEGYAAALILPTPPANMCI